MECLESYTSMCGHTEQTTGVVRWGCLRRFIDKCETCGKPSERANLHYQWRCSLLGEVLRCVISWKYKSHTNCKGRRRRDFIVSGWSSPNALGSKIFFCDRKTHSAKNWTTRARSRRHKTCFYGPSYNCYRIWRKYLWDEKSTNYCYCYFSRRKIVEPALPLPNLIQGLFRRSLAEPKPSGIIQTKILTQQHVRT